MLICFLWPELLKHPFIHTSVQSVLIFKALFSAQGAVSDEEEGLIEEL